MPAKKDKSKKSSIVDIDKDQQSEELEDHEFTKKDLPKKKKKTAAKKKTKKSTKKTKKSTKKISTKGGKKKKKSTESKSKTGKKKKKAAAAKISADKEEKKIKQAEPESEPEQKSDNKEEVEEYDEAVSKSKQAAAGDEPESVKEDERDTEQDGEDSIAEFEKYLHEAQKKKGTSMEEDFDRESGENVEEKDDIDKEEIEEEKKRLEQQDERKGKEKKQVQPEDEEEEEVDKKLVDIYENEDGTMPDMKSFKKKKRNRLLRALFFLFVSLALLAGVAWAGFFLLQPRADFSEEDVALTITGDEQVDLGEEVTYRVRYKNSQTVPLNDAVLLINYPKGFVFEQSSLSPTGENNNQWDLGFIDANTGDYIDIRGRIYATAEEKQSFRVFLNYTPANFSSQFQKVATLPVGVGEIPIEISINGPQEVVPGVESEFTIEVKKQSGAEDKDISNIAVVFDGGELFNIKSSDAEIDSEDNNQWNFDNLNEARVIKLSGVFNLDDETIEQTDIKVKVVGWKDENRQGEEYIYKEEILTIDFLQTDLAANLVINGTTNDFSVQPGEMLISTVAIRNAGEKTLNDVSVKVSFDGPAQNNFSILKWSDFVSENNPNIYGEQLSENVRLGEITWTASHISELAELDEGETVLLDFQMPLKTMEDIDLTGFSTHEIRAYVEVQYGIDGVSEIYSSNPLIMTVNSDVSLEVRDQVSTNSQEQDVHTITWFVENNFHELEDLYLEADVYGDINVDEESIVVPAGEVEYVAEEQRLIWRVDSMPTGIDVLALRFNVTILRENPTQTNLTSKVKFKANDTVTGQEILLMGDEIMLPSEQNEQSQF